MNARLLAVVATTLLLTSTAAVEANDLRFAFRKLLTTRSSETRVTSLADASEAALHRHPAAVDSALRLGAYLEETDGGLHVTGTLPGSPARDALRPGDIIRRIAIAGQPPRQLNTLLKFEYAKRDLGPDRRAALEVLRPGHGTRYVWVTFRTAEESAGNTTKSLSDARSLFNHQKDHYVHR